MGFTKDEVVRDKTVTDLVEELDLNCLLEFYEEKESTYIDLYFNKNYSNTKSKNSIFILVFIFCERRLLDVYIIYFQISIKQMMNLLK